MSIEESAASPAGARQDGIVGDTPQPPNDPQALREEIERTREQLGSTGQEEAPQLTDARRSWRQILIAAAVQGSIFAMVKAALDRATAQGTDQLTGDDADEPVSAGA